MPSKSKRPWTKYKARFDAREWETCTAMGRALKIPQGTILRHTKGWHEDRDEIERAGQEEYRELAIHHNAQSKLDIYRDIKPMLEQLFLKGINQLLAKQINPKTGKLEVMPFASEATALGASRFGLAGLKLLESGNLPGGALGGHSGNPLIIDGDALNEVNIASVDPRNFTSDQLRSAIAALDSDEGTQEKASNGTASKKRSSR